MTNCAPVAENKIFLEELRVDYLSDNYINWMKDREVTKYLTGGSKDYTVQELKEYVNKMNESKTDFLLGIFLKDGKAHIGNIKIGCIDSVYKFGNLGLLIGDKDMWGKGLATEAIILATKYAFDKLKLNKLKAGIIIENKGSHKAFLKAGYREVEIIKNYISLNGNNADVILVEKCREEVNAK